MIGKEVSAIKLALARIEQLEAENRRLSESAREPIAIVGMACRFPPRSEDPEAFWEMLRDGREALSEVPADRWDVEAYFDPDPDAPGKVYTRFGAFLDQVTAFDPEFFGISPREAHRMDPQQRLLLEVAWEAVERSGWAPDSLRNSRLGVYIGSMWNEFTIGSLSVPAEIDAFVGTGSAGSFLPARLSYHLGSNGPSVHVDAACSSALVALHLACQGLRRRECDRALAGGVNLMLSPEPAILNSKLRALSPDGRSKTFDAAADGYGRGEGCGVVALRRLADAVEAGDPILAVLRGSAVNHNGPSSGFTVPSARAQQEVIESALRDAGVEPARVSYLEAHGTGTPLGDPIELRAAWAALGPGREPAAPPLVVSSVKPNVGHLEGASGIAGLIKTVLCLRHRQFPPHRNLRELNPKIAREGLPLHIPLQLESWPAADGRARIAGVSSFGISGINAHVVVEEAPADASPSHAVGVVPNGERHLLVLSARSGEALRELAGRYRDRLADASAGELADVAYTSGVGRGHFEERAALVVRTAEEARELLARLAAGEPAPGLYRGRARVGVLPELGDPGQTAEERARLYTEGGMPAFADRPRRKVPLPTYPFQRQRYGEDKPRREPFPGALSHPLLGVRQELASGETVHTQNLGFRAAPWLAEHRVFAAPIAPGALFLAMAMAGLGTPCRLSDGLFPAPLRLDGKGGERGEEGEGTVRRVQLLFAPTAEAGEAGEPRGFKLWSCRPGGEEDWTLHAEGKAERLNPADAPGSGERVEAVRRRLREHPVAAFYSHLAAVGLELGASFRGLAALWRGEGEALGEVRTPPGLAVGRAVGDLPIHPVVLDACLQVMALVRGPELDGAYVPFRFERAELFAPVPERFFCHARRTGENGEGAEIRADLRLLDADGGLLGRLEGCVARRVSRQSLLGAEDLDGWLYEVEWRDAPAPLAGPALPVDATGRVWLIAADRAGVGAGIAARLSRRGQLCVLAEPGESFSRLTAERFQLPGDETQAWESLLAAALPREARLAGVIHLWSLDAAPTDATTATTLASDVRHGCASVLALAQALVRRDALSEGDAGDLWLLTAGAWGVEGEPSLSLAQSPLWGLGRVLARELPDLRCRRCRLADLDASPPPEQLDALVAELLLPTGEEEILWRGGRRRVPRLVHADGAVAGLPVPEAGDHRLERAAAGTLGGMRLEPLRLPSPAEGEVRIAVEAAGLNFRDLLGALGLYPGDPGPLGGEVAGRIEAVGPGVAGFRAGDEVVALAPGAFSTRVHTPAVLVSPKPAALRFAEAASLPIAFATVEIAFSRAALRAGQSVLIHAASGGVGLAAVQRARAAGARVFATASALKQDFLRSLGVERVYDSRTTEFSRRLRIDTGGAGVDVVLNSLTGEGFVEASLAALARGGAFVELGKRGTWSAGEVARLRPDVRYEILALDDLLRQEPERVGAVLRDLMARAARGEIAPLPLTVYPLAESRAAFLYMEQARHVGKIVLDVGGLAGGRLRKAGTYLLTGGLGGLGLAVARWLARSGVERLMLNSRRPAGEEAEASLAELRGLGAEVEVVPGDVSRESDVRALFERIDRGGPPLAGVFHLAAVLRDGALLNQTWDRFAEVLAPKVLGAWHLDRLTRDRSLDAFVLFSSSAALLGQPGQASYAAANAFLDALAHHRRASGLPAVSIDWGAWSKVGVAARRRGELAARAAASGMDWISPDRGLAALARVLARGAAQTAVLPVDWSVYGRDGRSAGRRFLSDLTTAAAVRHGRAAHSAGTHRIVTGGGWRRRLERAPVEERLQVAVDCLRGEVQGLLQLKDLPAVDARLFDLGMDSLLAIELRNRLDRELDLGRALPATALFDHPDIGSLARQVLARFAESAAAPPAPAPTVRATYATGEAAGDDAVAIIGLSCRLPGAPDPEAFWDLLVEGREAIVEVPRDRWDADFYFDPDPDAPGKTYARKGGFLDQVDRFDPHFFGISPREAVSLDPQHRLLLEVTWEALERAGLPPERLRGSRTGVYVGLSSFDYAGLQRGAGDAYVATGTAHSIAAGRISYLLGLQGPSLAIDTACSSSLVAVHQACRALLSGECDLVLAGGANAILTPENQINFAKARMLSPAGRCKTFDAGADGFVRGEGCGVVVLKRLSDAEREGDTVLAVVRGSAVNQDGASTGLTVPNGPAQEAVIREALERSGLAPREVVYLEAHGTGTSLGDPIEVQAAAAVLGERREPGRPLLLGSVKTNIGHLEAGAGIAGLIKVILSMQHGILPRHLHFEVPNPFIPWDELPVRVTAAATPWPAGRKVAGVSSFGFSGTNAHVVVEGPPTPQEAAPAATPERSHHLIPLSARSADALIALAARYLAWWDRHPEVSPADLGDICDIGDIGHGAGAGRAHFEERAALVVRSAGEARALLAPLRAGEPAVGLLRGRARSRPKTAWLFTGQGSQHAGMGRELHATQPVFREVLERCAQRLSGELERPLLDVLFQAGENGSGPLDRTLYTQPALFALEVALAALWRSWGMEPDAVLGHSLGEYAAAVVAGIFPLETGLDLVAKRARLMDSLPAHGAMAAVFADPEVIAALLADDPRLSLAADNGDHRVVSGLEAAVEAAVAALSRRGLRCQRLKTSQAFHSSLVEPALGEFESFAAGFAYRPAERTLISNLTGRPLAPGEILDAAYWRRQAREPVRFAPGVQALAGMGIEVLLELGPHPVLLGMAGRSWPEPSVTPALVPSLRRGRGEMEQLTEAVAALYVRGLTPDFAAWDRPWPRRRPVLPTYPFQRQRYWVEEVRIEKVGVEEIEAAPASPTAPEPGSRPAAVADLLYEVRWRPVPRGGLQADFLPPLPQLTPPPELPPSAVSWAPDDEPGFREDLEDLACRYGVQAFAGLGPPWASGAVVSAASLCQAWGVAAAHHQRLVARLLVALGDRGWLRPAGDDAWQVVETGQESGLVERRRDLAQSHPAAEIQLALLGRCGERLADVLLGEVDPLSLLFPSAGPGVGELYRLSPAAGAVNAALRRLFEQAAAALPSWRRLRVLEVGAGTGGATASILPALPAGRYEYVYTDLSAGFFAAPERRFAGFPGLRFEVFDVERDPGLQGFPRGQFDVVLAANVLHATRDVEAALRHVRRLLVPGGWLVLVEGTEPQSWLDLTFGLLPGWWRFADGLRTEYPLMDVALWRRTLAGQGFADTRAFAPAESSQAVLVSRAAPTEPREGTPAPEPPAAGGESWLLFADEADERGLGRRLADLLEASGRRCHVARPDAEAEGFDEILARSEEEGFPLAHVVHLLGLDLTSEAPEALESLETLEEAERSLAGAVALCQAIERRARPVRLWLVTRGSQAVVEGEITEPAQALLWGLGKVVALEQADRWGGLIDLPVEPDGATAEALFRALVEAHGEDPIAIRGPGWYAPRLARLAVPRSVIGFEGFEVSGEATYLVTGGFGPLGLATARWLVERGARHLVLGSRSPLPESIGDGETRRRRAAGEGLRRAGAEVHVLAADLGDAAELAAAWSALPPLPPLRGVIHAAGAGEPARVAGLTPEAIRTVIGAKATGALNLHRLTAGEDLRFFVCFSSATTVWGAEGQAHYAAANAFLDSLVHYRRASGLPGLSVDWARWSIGRTGPEYRDWMEKIGLQAFPPAAGLAALAVLLEGDFAQAVVADVRWERFKAVYESRRARRLLAEIEVARELPVASAEPRGGVRERLLKVAPRERRAVLCDHLQGSVAAVLRLRDKPDTETGFFDLGMDSLMAVELRNRLERELTPGEPLSSTLAFDHPTVTALAGHLLGLLGLQPLAPSSLSPVPLPAAASSLATLLEPVAILGASCRFPGAPSPEDFWRLLAEGRDAIGEMPPGRWDADSSGSAEDSVPAYRQGGFLPRVDLFDPLFFGISPREAVAIDPQQRLLLEVSWEALERAGLAVRDLAGKPVGVFVGITNTEYGTLLNRGGRDFGIHAVTGTPLNAAAGRLAYTFGFIGPAIAVDTACSSSLTALHQACASLRSGECDLAMAGGVNVILNPESTLHLARAGMLSAEGRCKTFDAAADGFVRGEGCGVVVLKRLSDALRDGDPLLAVVRGSAVNQDGASSGMTVPHGPSQQRVIAAALRQAGCAPAEVDYLEAHGTGTALGDPIEVQAAAAVLGDGREAERPLLLGSVKTNLGHLESAAGMASLIKVLLAFEHGTIPAHLHFHTPNPHVPWRKLPVEVATRARPWPAQGRPPLAGISSFGASGTNAHVIVEGPPVPAPREEGGAERSHHLWVLSARSEPALRELAARYLGRLEEPGEVDLGDFGYTSGVGRSHLEERAALVVGTVAEARELLARLGAGEPAPGLYRGRVKGRPRVAWFFGGIDSAGMGGELYSTQPVFRAAVDRCGGLAVLLGGDEDESGFALAMGLAELWRSWGVEPDVVFGEGAGERVAEVVAGMLSLDSGLGSKQFGELGVGVLMEMGSRSALLDLAGAESPLRVASLLPGRGETFQLATGMACLYAAGVTPSFADWDRPWPRRKVALPTYPFERQRYWVEPSATRSTAEARGAHPFLGVRQESAVSGEVVYANALAGGSPGYLADHVIYERMAMPASGFAALVLGSGPLPLRLLGMSILEPLLLSAQGARELQLSLEPSPDGGGSSSFQLHSRAGGVEEEWTLHCRGRVEPGPEAGAEPRASESLESLQSRLDVCEPQELYERSAAQGLVLGPAFRGIRRLWSRGGEALAEIVVPSGLEGLGASLPIHPAVLDACTQASAVASQDLFGSGLYLPIEYQELVLYRPVPARFYCHVRQRVASGEESRTFDLELFDEAERPLGALRGFVVKRAPRQALLRGIEREVGGLLYGVEWRAAPREETVPRASAGRWWIVAEKDLGVGLARELALQGRTAMGVDTGVWTEWEGPLEGVVALAEPTVRGAAEDPLDAARAVCEGPLDLVQALLGRQVDLPRGLWLVTRGGVGMAGDSGLDPWSALLWGFGRVVASEQPGLGCRLLDVDPAAPWPLADLARRLTCETGDAQEVWRGENHYVPRLAPLRLPGGGPGLEVRSKAAYLVTGGLGSLGRRAAHWLARRGARHLVLVGRQPSGEVAAEVVTELASLGCQARVVAADVSRSEDVSSLLAEIASMGMPLRGVVHAAGVLDDGMVGSQSWDRFAGVLSPKLAGAWHLHTQTAGLPLDFFVLYSSIAPLLGVPGQSSYAAANAYLDALAWERRRQGLAATSVNWGPWSAGGMASERSLETRLRSRGLGLLETEEAHAALERLVVGGMAQGAVLRADWRRYGVQSSVPPSLLKELCAPGAGDSDLLARLTALSPEGRRGAMAEHLKREVQLVLALPGPPDPEEGFFNLGMDSMLSVELINRLQAQLGTSYRLASTVAFDYPTVTSLAGHLSERLLGLAAKPALAREPRRGSLDEPVAIVGLGCRFPGAPDVESYWRLLRDGVDAIREVPAERWDIESFYDPDPEAPGKMTTRFGGFLEGIDRFDPQFFSISPREAATLDPQQRLLLEVTWEALENAGIPPQRLFGTRTGVYMGMGTVDYSRLLAEQGIEAIDQYLGTGNALSAAVGRLSFVYGFQGPCMAVDTACSASLVALNQACRALLSGDCEVALAGGVNAILSPDLTVYFSKARMMAPDGRCKAFDAAADGYVRGEGCGIVVLKRLSDAEREGDRIWGLIRGSAVNQDGRSSGLTVPNGPSQERVIREALAQGGVEPEAVSYVEAHGTGTALGDPIEIGSLEAVFGAGRARRSPLLVGSVKTNVGHLETAAGIAGLIKVVLSMEGDLIPAHLHFRQPSPRMAWEEISVRVSAAATPWPAGRKVAGVSSFAFSGTNAHVVVEEAPPSRRQESAGRARRSHLLVLSARQPEALSALAGRYRSWLLSHPEADLGDVAYTAGVGRNHLEERAGLVASTAAAAVDLLGCLERGESAGGLFLGSSRSQPKVAWLFPGEGSGYLGMGRELYSSQPVFREVVERCSRLLDVESLLDDETRSAGPALLAVELGLAALWRSFGQEPEVLVGEGVGEIAAAVVAGVTPFEEGVLAVTTLAGMAEVERMSVWSQTGEALGSGVETLARLGIGLLLEVGPHPVLSERVVASWPAAAPTPILAASLRREAGENGQLAAAAAILHVHGRTLDFAAWDHPWPRRRERLPTYPFQRQRYWLEPGRAGRPVGSGPSHPLLGTRQELASGEEVYTQEVSCRRQPWLADHRVFDTVVVPAASHLAMVLASVRGPCRLSQGLIQRALQLESPESARELQLMLKPETGGEQAFQIFSRPSGGGTWTLHVEGRRAVLPPPRPEPSPILAPLRQRLTEQAVSYESLAAVGLQLGPSFRGMTALWRGAGEALTLIRAPEGLALGELPIHPAVLDACLQSVAACGEMTAAYVPFQWERIELYEPVPPRFFCHARLRQTAGTDGASGNFETVTADLLLIDPADRLLGRIEGYVAKRATREAMLGTSALAGWLYEVEWRRQEGEGGAGEHPGALWLLAGERRGLGSKLGERLERAGQRVVFVEPATDVEAWERRLAEELPRESPLHGVIQLSSAADAGDAAADATPAAFERALDQGCGGALALVQALARRAYALPGGLWWVTRGAQSIAGEACTSLSQAPLWGLGKVVALEHPELSCRRVDLEDRPDAADLDGLVRDLLGSGDEDQVAWRGGHRWVPRLIQSGHRSAGELPLRVEATYLVTGGLGGLGLEVARWLVERGARRLVLNGRRPPAAEAAALLAELRARGAEVEVVLGDVAREEDVARLLGCADRADRPEAPLRGIFHLAGVLHDGALVNENRQHMAEVLAPKALGAWHLHRLTAARPPELFVLFASTAGLFGNRGQAGYAAANSFLDTLARHRRAQGLPAISIDWGAWSEVGVATRRRDRVDRRLAEAGVSWIAPEQGLRTLEMILAGGPAQVGALPVDWETFGRRLAGDRVPPFLRLLVADRPRVAAGKVAAGKAGSGVLRRLREVPEEDRLPLLRDFVAEEVRRSLRLPDRPPAAAGFFDLGLDSLLAVELRNRFNEELQPAEPFPATLLFDAPSVGELARHLALRLGTLPAVASVREPGVAPPPPAQALREVSEGELGRLGEDEVDSMIDELYEEMAGDLQA